jgi:hypothetical protein
MVVMRFIRTGKSKIAALLLCCVASLTALHPEIVQSQPAQEQRANHSVWIKYRNTPVDVGHPRFQYLDTTRSSFVTGAWYDSSNRYMVIGLRGTNYHYCQMPEKVWISFRAADSFGTYYNRFIMGRYDCRLGGVPMY